MTRRHAKRSFKTTLVALLGILLGMMALSGCDNPTPTPAPAQGVNLLIAVEGNEGNVRLKREAWAEYTPVDFGTPIQHTDLVSMTGTASVLCTDLAIETVTGRTNVPCPPAFGWLEREGAYYGLDATAISGGVRAGLLPDDVPYIQHPRNTLIIDPRPRLRWHATGAVSYTVTVMQSEKTIWRREDVVGNETQYPAEAPTLRPGRDYLLRVQDNASGAASGDDPTRGIGFRVIAPEHREAVVAHRDAILALPELNDATRNFALAVYYATWEPPIASGEEKAGETTEATGAAGAIENGGRSLWGESWLLLETVTETHDTPAVHLWTGDVLSAMKLPDEAKRAYQLAQQQGEALGDLESQAAAHAGLWRVTGDETHREKAIELYGQLGAEAALKEFEEEK